MSLDLSKLSPAPFLEGDVIYCADAGGIDEVGFFNKDRYPVEAEFHVLARRAFDIMMRRGWTARKSIDGRTWIVQVHPTSELLFHPKHAGYFQDTDPFTALVEADRWYAANVEQKAATT